MTTPIAFFAGGVPAPKGSARAFVVKGRAVITNDCKKAKPWASVITLAARDAMAGRAPWLVTPLKVTIDFYLDRPKGHYRKSKGCLVLPDTAPVFVATRPDVDKLARNAIDALTGVVFRDDSLIVSVTATKRYASGQTGALISIEEMPRQLASMRAPIVEVPRG